MHARHTASLVLMVLASTVTAPLPSRAAWTHASNVNLRVAGAQHDQKSAKAVSDGNGGALIVWSDERDTLNADIYAQHVLRSGVIDPTWPVDGMPVCTAPGGQSDPVIMADGAGGAIVVWEDNRGVVDLYAQRILPDTGVDPTWPVNGVAVSTSFGSQWAPALASDGAGGVLVAFVDNGGVGGCDVRVEHVKANGVADPAWPANGRFLTMAPDCQDSPTIVADGNGGALVVWEDARDGVQFDIYATRVLADGTLDPAWPVNGLAVCTAPDNQYYPSAVSDGAGGAIVAWEDWRSPTTPSDIYAMRVLPNGALGAGWPVNGRVLCSAPEPQEAPLTVSDGAGGAVMTWFDSRTFTHKPYGHRVTGAGVVAAGWTANGRLLSVEAGDDTRAKDHSVIISDGAGGAIVAWEDDHDFTSTNISAQHLLSSGALDPVWPQAGVLVCDATGRQIDATIASDGAGGAIVAWTDDRDISVPKRGTDIYAQRIDHYGKLGSPEPSITGAADVPADQGRHVALTWIASYLESAPYSLVTTYKIFRSDVPSPYAWQEVGSIPASGASSYAFAAPTLSDSSATGTADATFKVEARSAGGLVWASDPATAHSVDNLGVPGDEPTRLEFSVSPNPTIAMASMKLALPRRGQLRLAVYDVGGRRVRLLAEGALEAGVRTIEWDLRDDRGRHVNPGLYFVRLDDSGETRFRRLAIGR